MMRAFLLFITALALVPYASFLTPHSLFPLTNRWEGLWLNEGFAAYMEHFCVDALFPGE